MYVFSLKESAKEIVKEGKRTVASSYKQFLKLNKLKYSLFLKFNRKFNIKTSYESFFLLFKLALFFVSVFLVFHCAKHSEEEGVQKPKLF